MALVLSRKQNEQTIATTASGEQIVITVVEIRGDKVRLAYDAPLSVKITRPDMKKGAKAA